MRSEEQIGRDPAAPERLRAELVEGRTDGAGRLFAAAGAPRPVVIWAPELRDLQHPVLRRLLAAVRAVQGPGGLAPRSILNGPDYAALADWCMVVEPDADGRDMVYAHYGAEIVRHYGADLTGRRTSEIGGHVARFFIALYGAVMERREIAASIHEPPSDVFVRTWRRLIVPLADPGGEVGTILVGNVADNDLRAGFDAMPDAVILVDVRGRVVFANRGAYKLFETARGAGIGAELSAFTGAPIELPPSPEDLVRSGARWIERMTIARGADALPIQIGLGATYYRDAIFFVVTARPRYLAID